MVAEREMSSDRRTLQWLQQKAAGEHQTVAFVCGLADLKGTAARWAGRYGHISEGNFRRSLEVILLITLGPLAVAVSISTAASTPLRVPEQRSLAESDPHPFDMHYGLFDRRR